MIKNIVFDMGGVLIDWKPREFCQRLGVTNAEEIDILVEAIYHSKEWSLYDEGKIKIDDLKKSCLQRLPEKYHKIAIKLIYNWPSVCNPTLKMPELLKNLKHNGYHLFLLSNAGYNQPKYFNKFPYNDVFEGKIVSAFYKLLKPDVRIYDLLIDKYHLKKEETFFMDDNQINVDGAIKAGISACLFKDYEQLKEEMRKDGIII